MGKGKTLQHSCLALRHIKCYCVFFSSFAFNSLYIFCLIHPIAVVFEVISFASFVSSRLTKSWMSSSHPFFGLPTGLLVLILLTEPGCQSKILLVPCCHYPLHPSVCLYPAKYLHFFKCSSASLVLLLMNSIHSSSFSLLSFSSSLSSWTETNITVLIFVCVLFGALSSFFVGHAMRVIFFSFSRSSC